MTYPFEITPSGKVAESSGVDAMLEQVQFVLSTTLGSRAMNLNFGSRVATRLFDAMDLPDDVRADIYEAVETHVPGVAVDRVEVSADEEIGTLDVRVWITPRDEVSDRVFSVSLSFGRVVEESVQ